MNLLTNLLINWNCFMDWITNYQLFMFDFDGLLVDTENLHYQAYISMCANRGFNLTWSFDRFSQAAHHSASALQQDIYAEFPDLQKQEPNWAILYKEKQHFLIEAIENNPIQLMPGVDNLLQQLEHAHIARCVVTNSPFNLIEKIRQKNAILNSIPTWITRQDYTHPKPHPECYLKAIDLLSKPHDRIIGFEDSPKGLQALLKTPAKAVLVCPHDAPYLDQIFSTEKNFLYYPSFSEMTDKKAP